MPFKKEKKQSFAKFIGTGGLASMQLPPPKSPVSRPPKYTSRGEAARTGVQTKQHNLGQLFPNTASAMHQTHEAMRAIDDPVNAETAGRGLRQAVGNTIVGGALTAGGLAKDVVGPLAKPAWDFGKGFLGFGDSSNGPNTVPNEPSAAPRAVGMQPNEVQQRLPDPPASTTHQDGRRAPFYSQPTRGNQATKQARASAQATRAPARPPAYSGMANDPETVQVIRGMDRYNQNPNHFGINFLPGTTGSLQGDIEQAEIVKRGGSIADAAQLRIDRGKLGVARGQLGVNRANTRTNPFAGIGPDGKPAFGVFDKFANEAFQLPGFQPPPIEISGSASGTSNKGRFEPVKISQGVDEFGEPIEVQGTFDTSTGLQLPYEAFNERLGAARKREYVESIMETLGLNSYQEAEAILDESRAAKQREAQKSK